MAASNYNEEQKESHFFYVRGLSSQVKKSDLFSLFRALPITKIQLDIHNPDLKSNARIEVNSKKALDEALATFDDIKVASLDSLIKVSGSDDFSFVEQKNHFWLQVTQVSEHANTHDLYNIFRRTGPISEFFITPGREGKPYQAWVKYVTKSLAHKGIEDHHFQEYLKKSLSIKMIPNLPELTRIYFVNPKLPVALDSSSSNSKFKPKQSHSRQSSESMNKEPSNAFSDSGYMTSPTSQVDTFHDSHPLSASQFNSENRHDFDSKVLYVYNLNIQIDNTELFNMFKTYGFISSAIVVKDRLGQSKGYGSVRFTKSTDPSKAYNGYLSSKSPEDPIELEIGRPRNVAHIQPPIPDTKPSNVTPNNTVSPTESSIEDYRSALNEKISKLKGIDQDNANYVTQLVLDLYPEYIESLLKNQNLLQQKVLTVLSKLIHSTPKQAAPTQEPEPVVVLEPFKSTDEQPAFIRDMSSHLKSIPDDTERRTEFSSYLLDFVETAGAKDPDEMTRRLAFKSADIFVIVQIMFDQAKFTKLIKELDGSV